MSSAGGAGRPRRHAPVGLRALGAGALALLVAGAEPSRAAPGASVFLPSVLSGAALPAPDLAVRLHAAAALEDPSLTFPAYAGPPTQAAAHANVEAACLDAPALDDAFGPGAQAVACRAWMASALGNWHAARLSGVVDGRAAPADAVWAAAYLRLAVQATATLAYGPGDGPLGAGGLRDTRGAVWQNPARLVDIVVIADDLARAGRLDPDLEAHVTELASAIVRAWRAAWWEVGVTPGTGIALVTQSAAASPAASLAGAPVASETGHGFAWDADRGNSPAEEMAWMSAGVLLAARWLDGAIPDDERAGLAGAGRHYAAFALSAGRRDPRSGAAVWTLGTETSGGPYGQNAGWLENHQPDVPSLPYLGVTWFYLAAAELAWPNGLPRPWQPDADIDPWPTMRDGAEATIRAPGGRLLFDLSPGRPVDYALAPFPEWSMPCGSHQPGALYVATGLASATAPRYVSEIGEPAAMALLPAAVPIAKAAAARGDTAAAARWEGLAHRALDDLDDAPASLEGLGCKVAPWTAGNRLYHRAAIASQLTSLWRVAAGRTVFGPRTSGGRAAGVAPAPRSPRSGTPR